MIKVDMYPLPRIDDLLDKLGKTKCFSTLDLTAGYIGKSECNLTAKKRLHSSHIRACIYKFKVMPFGVMNAPAVFERLMQKVLARLMIGPEDFVAIYWNI